tara:strand:- start:4767 stop:4943 length:177 start_codon:yes stop_codon:yes gene_type:complete
VPDAAPNQSVNPLSVGMVSLGCAKNSVDAEVMLGALMADGLEVRVMGSTDYDLIAEPV